MYGNACCIRTIKTESTNDAVAVIYTDQHRLNSQDAEFEKGPIFRV